VQEFTLLREAVSKFGYPLTADELASPVVSSFTDQEAWFDPEQISLILDAEAALARGEADAKSARRNGETNAADASNLVASVRAEMGG